MKKFALILSSLFLVQTLYALDLNGTYEQVGNCDCKASSPYVCEDMHIAMDVLASAILSSRAGGNYAHTAAVVKTSAGSQTVPMLVFPLKEWGKEFKVRQTDKMNYEISTNKSGFKIWAKNKTLVQKPYEINMTLPSKMTRGSDDPISFQLKVSSAQLDYQEMQSQRDAGDNTAGPHRGGFRTVTSESSYKVQIKKQAGGSFVISTYSEFSGNFSTRYFSCLLRPVK